MGPPEAVPSRLPGAGGTVGFAEEPGAAMSEASSTKQPWGAAEKAADLCGDHTLLIVAEAETGATGPCLMIDREMLAVTGPVALFTDADGVRIVPADNGTRLWNRARQ